MEAKNIALDNHGATWDAISLKSIISSPDPQALIK